MGKGIVVGKSMREGRRSVFVKGDRVGRKSMWEVDRVVRRSVLDRV